MSKRYGQWAGNLKGHAEDKTRCIEEVWDGFFGHQCNRRRWCGPDGKYCKQHAKRLGDKEAANKEQQCPTGRKTSQDSAGASQC